MVNDQSSKEGNRILGFWVKWLRGGIVLRQLSDYQGFMLNG